METKLGHADENEAEDVCACGHGSAIIISQVLKYVRIGLKCTTVVNVLCLLRWDLNNFKLKQEKKKGEENEIKIAMPLEAAFHC